MKKLLFTMFAMVSLSAIAQQIAVTNLSYDGTFPTVAKPVFTNRVHLLSVTVVSPNNNTTIELFNQITNSPYFGTNTVIVPSNSYVTKSFYTTNVVTTYIQADTGITNYFTNAGLWTYSVTNTTMTNRLPPAAVFVGGANPVTYPVDLLYERGLSVRVSTNAIITLYYNYAQ